MKRYNKIVLSALLFSGFAFTACQDESGFESIKIVPGEEIIFGATAHFEDGNSANTRTIYGNEVTDDEGKGLIEVNWKYGDKIQIASPHTRPDIPIAEYMVGASSDATLGEEGGSELSSVTELQRIGDAGLQWTEEDEYEFYAVYPSINQAAEVISELKESDEYGLKEENGAYTFTGYLPTVQDPVGFQRVYTAIPDMRFAYMVAQEHYEAPRDRVIDESDEKIQLPFSSLTTALEFDITANVIGVPNTAANYGNIVVTDLTLYSSKGNNICGKFKYTFPQGEEKTIEDGKLETLNTATGYNSVSMSLGNGVSLTQGDAVRATFFLLPIVKECLKAQDLKLIIHYTVNGFMQTKTATINRDIYPRTKYHFKNMVLPPITEEIKASVWFQALDPQTYLSQVSIPVASNVFALEKIGSTSTKFSASSCQQVKSFTDLWDMGVRGFEIQTQKAVNNSNVSDGTLSLGTAYFTCDENRFESPTYNFNYAFTTLVDKLRPIVDGKVDASNECLILVCTYQASNDGYNPNHYVSQLVNYLDAYLNTAHAKDRGVIKDDFIQIKAGTTAGEIKGKIAIIIRPGDDDRYQTNSTTASIELKNNDSTSDWSDHLTLIQDWGTAFDVWDRRYEGVARESTFETKYVIEMAKKRTEAYPQIEDWLWGVSSSNGSYTAVDGQHDFNDGTTFPTAKGQFDYAHTMKGNTKGTAYVQEWARVSPKGGVNTVAKTETFGAVFGYGGTTRHLWVNWPSSIDEKKTAIDGLFELSVAEKGKSSNNLYINSLSGYYITSSVQEGLYPFKETFKGHSTSGLLGTTYNFSISKQGQGGDHVSLAYDLNKYVYNILKGDEPLSSTGEYLADGPWGLVMMEHIGNTAGGTDDKSQQLVNLIMMNNFKFPLATAPVNVDEGGNGGTVPAVAEVTFNDSPVDPKAEIY